MFFLMFVCFKAFCFLIIGVDVDFISLQSDAVAVVCLAPVGCDQVVGVERHLGRRPLLWSTSSGSAQSRSGSINNIKLFCLYLHLTNVFVNYCKILTLK